MGINCSQHRQIFLIMKVSITVFLLNLQWDSVYKSVWSTHNFQQNVCNINWGAPALHTSVFLILFFIFHLVLSVVSLRIFVYLWVSLPQIPEAESSKVARTTCGVLGSWTHSFNVHEPMLGGGDQGEVRDEWRGWFGAFASIPNTGQDSGHWKQQRRPLPTGSSIWTFPSECCGRAETETWLRSPALLRTFTSPQPVSLSGRRGHQAYLEGCWEDSMNGGFKVKVSCRARVQLIILIW